MKRAENTEVEKYHLAGSAFVLVEHDPESDLYFAVVVDPEADFAMPLYSFNDASAFLTRYNPKKKFRTFEDALSYIESDETVQNELKSVIPDYAENDNDMFSDDEGFPLRDMIMFKARLLTDQFSDKELNGMLQDAKSRAMTLTDDVVADCFNAGHKKISHDIRTEYYRLTFLYTTFADTIDVYAEKDIDNVLSLIFDKQISVSGNKNKAEIYRKIREALGVYDDIFSDGKPVSKTVPWLKSVIYSILQEYRAV